MIDIRVGHIPGSDETRTYTRISDEEAGNNYFSGYGLENEVANKIEEDILPIECRNCGIVNSGHRKSCRECTDILDENNYLEGVTVKSAVTEDVEEMTHKLNKRIVKNETPLKDEKIDEQAKLIVAEEKGIDPEELEWS